MSDLKSINLFECTDECFEPDDATVARIEAGIRDSNAGRFVTSEEARRLVKRWISESSTRNPR